MAFCHRQITGTSGQLHKGNKAYAGIAKPHAVLNFSHGATGIAIAPMQLGEELQKPPGAVFGSARACGGFEYHGVKPYRGDGLSVQQGSKYSFA